MGLDLFVRENWAYLQETYPGIKSERLGQERKLCSSEEHFLKGLRMGMPLEYINGQCFFFRSVFEVNEGVFIPRFETEILVELATKELQKHREKTRPLRFVDIGCGSGNILISLLQNIADPMEAVGVDVSEKALKTAQRNFSRLRDTFSHNKKAFFVKSDRLRDLTDECFHVIVSNPPYIKRKQDQNKIHPQVKKWEPDTALYLEDETYESWFEELFDQSYKFLYRGGVLLMEGHEDCLETLAKKAQEIKGFQQVSVKKDYNRKNRFLILRK